MSEPGKQVVLTSIWWSNTKEGKELLQSIAAGLTAKGKSEFQKQIDSTPPQVDTMDMESPDVLDMLWGCFCATGDTKYVKRLMSTLSWSKNDAKDLPKMLIASAARWSLVSNVNQHEKVKEFCLSTASQDAELKPYLEAVLTEAATALAKANKEKQADNVVKDSDKQADKVRKDPDKQVKDSDKQADKVQNDPKAKNDLSGSAHNGDATAVAPSGEPHQSASSKTEAATK